MAWWQKKLLRFALLRTGFLDDTALNLDDLDMTWGKKNVVELKNVGLNITKISKLAKLPPELRLTTARVLSFRLTVPADIYHSSIIVELDGVEIDLRLDENLDTDHSRQPSGGKHHSKVQIPQHRKVHRRIRSPTPRGLSDPNDEHVPTPEELARSFLSEEPSEERKELVASVAAESKEMDASIISEHNSVDEYGTGVAIGVPGFLASFLQGIVDRMELSFKHIEAKLTTTVPGDGQQVIPIVLTFQIGSAAFCTNISDTNGARQISLENLSLAISSQARLFENLSLPTVKSDLAQSRSWRESSAGQASIADNGDMVSSVIAASPPLQSSVESLQISEHQEEPKLIGGERSHPDEIAGSNTESTVIENNVPESSSNAELEIQPGDDNISWGSRRSKASSTPADDLWRSMISEDFEPESLLIDRAFTPRVQMSRSSSPTTTRDQTNTAASANIPSRHQPETSSWPMLSQGDAQAVRPSPGSWPIPDQSYRSLYQPAEQDLESSVGEMLSNEQTPMLLTESEADLVPTTQASQLEFQENLAASRLFSHEEAQSMYMSALSHGDTEDMPRSWGKETTSNVDELRTEAVTNLQDSAASDDEQLTSSDSDSARNESDSRTSALVSGNETPRPKSPESDSGGEPRDIEKGVASVQLLTITYIRIVMPVDEDVKDKEDEDAATLASTTSNFLASTRGIPGTFSAYSEMSASRHRPLHESREQPRTRLLEPQPVRPPEVHEVLNISIGVTQLDFDMSSVRLLYRVCLPLIPILQQSSDTSLTKEASSAGQAPTSTSLTIEEFRLDFRDCDLSRPLVKQSETMNHLFTVGCHDIDVEITSSRRRVQLGKLTAHVGTSCLLRFEQEANLTSSDSRSFETPDVTITLSSRSSNYVELHTTKLCVLLDINEIDNAFSSLGGLSSILEAGNSVLAESSIVKVSDLRTKEPKGVRFTDDVSSTHSDDEFKVDIILEAFKLSVRTGSCSIDCHTSRIKALYRSEGLSGASINEISILGPYEDEEVVPLSINLGSIRVEYASSPHDRDLERLLTLLTPSKDKYDSDDDILVDTLLRQRKKGALARVSVGMMKVHLDNLNCLQLMSEFANDLSKLSVVTKYLPEDERPGILTLVRIKDIDASFPINPRFGRLTISCNKFHCAYVGLPLLLTLSLDELKVTGSNDGELVHALVPCASADGLPVVMLRMLGNEMEPNIKIKLFNLCFEYDVQMLLNITGMDQQVDAEEVIHELTKSVAGLNLLRQESDRSFDSPSAASLGSKALRIDLLIRSSAVGLSTKNSGAKGLFVLNEANFSTTAPFEKVSVVIQLQKATIFLADHIENDNDDTLIARSFAQGTNTILALPKILQGKGFASVGSIMAARVHLQGQKAEDRTSDSITVDVYSRLLLLETCADSTQTLISLMNGLSPPSQPSKQPKYLTEPMTIDDMMASFVGDTYVEPDRSPEKIFDTEDDVDSSPDRELGLPDVDNDSDGLLAESEMISSVYGPVSRILDPEDSSEDDTTMDGVDHTVESLLEEDPFEMPLAPFNASLSDVELVKELKKQELKALNDDSARLDLWEIEDLGFDAPRGDRTALGAKRSFSTPASGRRDCNPAADLAQPTFRLRVRDLHVIWNIYDGYDWQRTREGITEGVERIEAKAEERKNRQRQLGHDYDDEESVIGDFLFNSIYIGIPSNNDVQELRRQINKGIDDAASETESIPASAISRPSGQSTSAYQSRPRPPKRLKLARGRAHKVAFELKGVSADILVYPPESKEMVSHVDLRIRSFEIFDNVPTSTWRKFLTPMQDSTREMSKPQIHVELSTVRTLEDYAASEIVMHVSVLPLRLHVDQDALEFITRFFEFKDKANELGDANGEQPFIQRIEVDTVDLCLDYKPKRVDYAGLRSGHATEFKNFVILDAANIRLKHAIVYGIRGFEPLHQTLNDVWMPDIRRNQLPTILAGLAAVRSLVNIGTGVRDVIAVPVREYRKDGRIIRSIQKGAFHFGKTTSSELARLGAKVALGTQNILQGAEEMLSPAYASSSGRSISTRRLSHGDPDSADDEHERRTISAYADQPIGVLSGLRSARKYLERDLLTARDALIAVHGEVLDSSSPGGAAAAVARHAPTIIIRPVTGVSRAVGTALLGLGNQIDRDNLRRVQDKYKSS